MSATRECGCWLDDRAGSWSIGLCGRHSSAYERLREFMAGLATGTYPPVTNTGSEPISGSPAPNPHTDGSVTTHGPTDGTQGKPAPTIHRAVGAATLGTLCGAPGASTLIPTETTCPDCKATHPTPQAEAE